MNPPGWVYAVAIGFIGIGVFYWTDRRERAEHRRTTALPSFQLSLDDLSDAVVKAGDVPNPVAAVDRVQMPDTDRCWHLPAAPPYALVSLGDGPMQVCLACWITFQRGMQDVHQVIRNGAE